MSALDREYQLKPWQRIVLGAVWVTVVIWVLV